MSRSYSDTTGPSVSGPSCSYATLSHYNNDGKGGVVQLPTPKGAVSGSYVVPHYDTIGYDALQHGPVPSCSGYFNIGTAYKGKGGDCSQKYVHKLCQ